MVNRINAEFVKVAKSYSQRQGISYATWREVGVEASVLKAAGIEVLDLNSTGDLEVYVDGADESTRHGYLIKGGGGALTREKIVAAVARKFVCIADGSKLVGVLGRFPLPVEVIPMARSYVARQLVLLGGQPAWRMGWRMARWRGPSYRPPAACCWSHPARPAP